MEQAEVRKIVEALLFATGRPLGLKEIQAAFEEGTPVGILHEALESLKKEYEEFGKPFRLVEVAKGFQIRTLKEYAPWILRLDQKNPPRLSTPALEVLAIIAYRQPVTRPEIEDIRGVDSGGVLKSLIERRFIKIVGKKDEPGRPLIYATSPEFLQLFGLKDLSDLPSLKDFEEKLAREKPEKPEEEGLNLFEETIEAATSLRVAEMDEEGEEALNLLEEGLKQLKEVEKEIEKENEARSPEEPLDKADDESVNTQH
ncbi:MAG: SMC-Scp complex subunit ScpB [bacterium]|nr:SMC-Scp complex subunit ScpB [bacterium]